MSNFLLFYSIYVTETKQKNGNIQDTAEFLLCPIFYFPFVPTAWC